MEITKRIIAIGGGELKTKETQNRVSIEQRGLFNGHFLFFLSKKFLKIYPSRESYISLLYTYEKVFKYLSSFFLCSTLTIYRLNVNFTLYITF